MAGHGRRRRDPRGHWILLSLCGLTLACGLLLQGYAHGAVGESSRHAAAGGGAAPAAVAHGGPVLNLSGRGPQSARMPRRTIALTFDDGPDPRWTPQVLDVLERHGAHATFFVVGARVADHPGLVRRIVAEGNEIGVAHLHPHRPGTVAGDGGPDSSWPDPARARRRGRRPHPADPAAVLLDAERPVRDRSGRAAQEAGRAGLPRRAHRPGHRGLAAAGRRDDRPGRHAARPAPARSC